MMLKRTFAFLLALSVVNGFVFAEPYVPGFDRFKDMGGSGIDLGNILLSELSCAACHSELAGNSDAKRGPILTGIANRVDASWLRRFIRDPHGTKAGTTMPAVFESNDAAALEQVEQLLHFLMSSTTRLFPKLPATKDADLTQSSGERGRVLFHQVGCVACHEPATGLNTDEPEDDGRTPRRVVRDLVKSVPLPKLGEKYTHAGLTAFLLNPLLCRPSGRMPSLKLTFLEAADIALHLTGGRSKSTTFRVDSTIAAKGAVLFQAKGCVNCHDIKGGTTTASKQPTIRNIAGGCIQLAGSAPNYQLSKKQQKALIASVESLLRKSGKSAKVSNNAAQELARLNCVACHERRSLDAKRLGGVGRGRAEFFATVRDIDIGDEGRLPPPLTDVGAKLHTSWIKGVLSGKNEVRPHMLTRMPNFGLKNVEHIIPALEKEDLPAPPQPVAKVFPVKADVKAGADLMGKGCIQCHALKNQRMPGVVGTDLTNLDQRIRPRWFRELVLKPSSKRARTRMPNFFPEGKASVKDVLEGNVERQLASLWAYLAESDKLPVPQQLADANSASFELTPTERPIVMRTFFQDAGTKSVVVGNPAQVHYAFDADKLRLAVAWHGRFLDAHSTWFDRFTPPAKPLGKGLVTFPGSLIETTRAASSRRWIGYRMDQKGVPTLLYRLGDVEVHDHLFAPATRELVRMITLQSATVKTVELRLARGSAKKVSDQLLRFSSPAYSAKLFGDAKWKKAGSDWIINGDVDGQPIRVLYKWSKPDEK